MIVSRMSCISAIDAFMRSAQMTWPSEVSVRTTLMMTWSMNFSTLPDAFLAALQSHGLTVIPVERYSKIVESRDAVREATPIIGITEPVPASERIVTRLYRPRHVAAADVAGVLAER